MPILEASHRHGDKVFSLIRHCCKKRIKQILFFIQNEAHVIDIRATERELNFDEMIPTDEKPDYYQDILTLLK